MRGHPPAPGLPCAGGPGAREKDAAGCGIHELPRLLRSMLCTQPPGVRSRHASHVEQPVNPLTEDTPECRSSVVAPRPECSIRKSALSATGIYDYLARGEPGESPAAGHAAVRGGQAAGRRPVARRPAWRRRTLADGLRAAGREPPQSLGPAGTARVERRLRRSETSRLRPRKPTLRFQARPASRGPSGPLRVPPRRSGSGDP